MTETANYLANDKKSAYLQKLSFPNRTPVFREDEIIFIDKAKNFVQQIFNAASVSLLGLFVTSLFSWMLNTPESLRAGFRLAGWVCIGEALLMTALAFIAAPLLSIPPGGTLQSLLPIHVLQSGMLLSSAAMSAAGFLLLRLFAARAA